MKKNLLILFSLLLLFSVQLSAQTQKTKGKKITVPCKSSKSFSSKGLPPRGGRTEIPRGIEGKFINFGFSLGGTFAFMDALNTEKAFIGARGTVFVHAIIPKTKTFAIGIEGGFTYLLANEKKYKESFVAATRDGSSASDIAHAVKVSNWMLPTVQASFVGNFHPAERINIQIKGNIGTVLAMVPKYEVKYYIRETALDGFSFDNEYHFVYNNDMSIGLSATVGTKFLYAIAPFAEFGVGLDFSYMRFSYEKGWVSPVVKVEKELCQIGLLDLHIGIAFSF